MTYFEQKKKASQFAKEWNGRGDEKQETQKFWIDLLSQVLDIKDTTSFIVFEKPVEMREKGTKYIDCYIPSTKVLIEQKGSKNDLKRGILQSGGDMLTPFEQALRYNDNLPHDQKARWIIVCNFQEFDIYDMNQSRPKPLIFQLKDLPSNLGSFEFLRDSSQEAIKKEQTLSMKAGEIVGHLYDALHKAYLPEDQEKDQTVKSLNILCVRLVFCLFADDSGLFGKQDAFYDYLHGLLPTKARQALIILFKHLDTKIEDRDPYDVELNAFPYVNGGLFSDENVIIPPFTDEILHVLLDEAAKGFDWSGISPTIFGAVFESTLDAKKRHAGGMHYTSIENIHKVIDPLFLDDLKTEFNSIKCVSVRKTRNDKLVAFQKKLASIKVMDPAAGSGNFLTETYLCFRRMENECIKLRLSGQNELDFGNFIYVSIQQFYGIEINDFAVSVASAALWIAESQMMEETSNIIGRNLEFFPLKTYTNIHEGNALRMNWSDVVSKNELTYIIGNPPFIGYSMKNQEQKKDMSTIYSDEKGITYPKAGKIDYVAAWFFTASEYIYGTDIHVSFVATNSITQGEQVISVWQPLFDRFKIHIDFAYRTFIWDSEAAVKAHVHCVIIGFSCCVPTKPRVIYDNSCKILAKIMINPYLLDAPLVWIQNRPEPICNVLPMSTGNRPAGKGLIIEPKDYESFITKEPQSKKYIKKLTGGEQYINNKTRYCLWLVGVSPAEIRQMPLVMERLQQCKKERLAGAKDRQKLADTPTLFRETKNPENFIIIPATSSKNRYYVPIGFLNADVIPSNAATIIENATLYYFGILTSSIHNDWMRAVCGRLKSDYRYSKNIVYNNFPWPATTDVQKASIEQTAKTILDARNLYPDCSLADLYDETTMPVAWRKAHQANDKAVMKAYGSTCP